MTDSLSPPEPIPETLPVVWPLTGRHEELEALLRTVTGGTEGRPRHVVLAGPAGVGKTRLVREAVAVLERDGWAVVRVVGTRAAQDIPLGAFAPLLRGAIPADGDALRLMVATTEAVLAAAAERRLALVVDDAHQLDPTSATLVAHLAASGSLSVVVTVRSGVPCADAIVNLWKDGDARRLELQALSHNEVEEMLTAGLVGRVSRHAVAWAYRATEGNPLFLRELMETAATAGHLQRVEGLWQLRGQPQPSMRLIDLVAARLSGLDEAQRQLVELVALGEPVPLSTLEQLADVRLLDDLERRGALRLVHDADQLSVQLGHPLYGEVMRATIGAATARRVRRALAGALRAMPSRRGDDELRIATWLLDAGERPDRALLLRAASLATSALDHRLAAQLAEAAALEEPDLAAALTAAAAHRALGAFERAEELLAGVEMVAAGAVPSAPAPVRGYLFARVATLHWGLGRLDAACDLLERATAWSPDPAWGHWVRAQRVTQLATGGRLRDAVGQGRELLAEPGLDPATRLPLAVGLGFAWHQTGSARATLELIDDAVVAAGPEARIDWPPDAMWALVAINTGLRWAEAETRLLRLRDRALLRDDPATTGYAELLLGQLLLARGWVADALDRLTEAEAHLLLQDSRGLLGPCRSLRVAALGTAGTPHVEIAQYRAARRASSTEGWAGRIEAAQADVWAAAADGELSVAARLALKHAADCRQAPLSRALLLHDALRMGAPARQVLADLRAAARATDAPLAAACLAHAEATARADGPALDAAAARFVDIGADLRAAEAYAAAAVVHRMSGRLAPAAESARRSEELLSGCRGAAPPTLRASADNAGLTTREREIAVLAARGLPNAEIADRLVLSVRTVESHLYRATTKLGVARRDELGPLLGRDARDPSGDSTR